MVDSAAEAGTGAAWAVAVDNRRADGGNSWEELSSNM